MTISDQQILSIFSNEMNLCMSAFWKQILLSVVVSLIIIFIYFFYRYKKQKKISFDFKKIVVAFIFIFCLNSISSIPSFLNFVKYNNYLKNIDNINVANIKITETRQTGKKSGFFIYFTHENNNCFFDVDDGFLFSTLSKGNNVVIIYEDNITDPIHIIKGKYSGTKFKKEE